MLLVFDVGGTEIKYATMLNGNILEQSSFSTSIITSKESFYLAIKKIFDQYQNIEGVALSMPGVIDAAKGYIQVVSVFPYLCETYIRDELQEVLKVPVSLENDAKCAALCEANAGNAKDVNDAIVLVFGTGIGGSIIKDHHIHHGSHLFAGEISTVITKVDDNGSIEQWSDICSTKNLCKKVAKALNVESINGKEVYKLAKEGNAIVTAILDRYYIDIAIQLYNFQYIYDPSIILLGGGISKEPLFIEGIKKALLKLNINQIMVPAIDTCKYYNDANLLGAYYHFYE